MVVIAYFHEKQVLQFVIEVKECTFNKMKVEWQIGKLGDIKVTNLRNILRNLGKVYLTKWLSMKVMGNIELEIGIQK